MSAALASSSGSMPSISSTKPSRAAGQMASQRAGPVPTIRRPCSVSGGTRTNVPAPIGVRDEAPRSSSSPSRTKKPSGSARWRWVPPPSPGTPVTIATPQRPPVSEAWSLTRMSPGPARPSSPPTTSRPSFVRIRPAVLPGLGTDWGERGRPPCRPRTGFSMDVREPSGLIATRPASPRSRRRRLLYRHQEGAVVNIEMTGAAADERRDGAGFRADIEGLRGLAIALVVLYHSGLALSGGFIGVDVFFVISGFLITGLLLRDRELHGAIRFAAFYARRARRLLPAAALVAIVTLIVADRLLSPLDRPSVSLDGAAAALSVANIRFALRTDYFSPVGATSPFLHFWSLGFEEQFYILWPALLAVAAAWRPRLGAAVVLTIVLVASLATAILVTDQSPSTAFYLLPTRAWQLAAGGLLAVGAGAFDRAPRLVVAGGRILLGLAAWVGLGLIAGVAR